MVQRLGGNLGTLKDFFREKLGNLLGKGNHSPRVSPEESYYFNDGQPDWMKVWVGWKMMTFPTLTGWWWNQPI